MRRVLGLISAVMGLLVFGVTPALAQVGKGLSGPHYELNIIGVPKNKTATLTDSSRHTMFVPLETVSNVKIYVTGDADPDTPGTQCGDRFQIIDGNATDGDGATLLVPCQVGGTMSFEVYAVGLGTPGGSGSADVLCTFQSTIILSPDTAALCGANVGGFDFEVKREAGKPVRQNISPVFRASGCVDVNGSLTCDTGDTAFSNVWIFNIAELMSYYWDYENNGLKLMKVRFYPTTSGSWTVQ